MNTSGLRAAVVMILAAWFASLSGCQFVFLQKLLAPDGAAFDSFGIAVAISGDILVVGVPKADIGPNQDLGAVYVFFRDGNNWLFVTKLTASDGTSFDNFGESVAVDGDTIVVAARGAKVDDNDSQGAVYIFERLPSGAFLNTETQKLTASDGSAVDEFGTSVAIDGDTIVIGARFGEDDSNSAVGAAYVFERLDSGAFPSTESQKLLASDGAPGEQFGFSVSIFANTIVVGARLAKIGGNVLQGAAYVFERLGSGAFPSTETQKLTASDGAVNDRFGSLVAIGGDTIVVGAPTASVGTNFSQGAAYVFERLGSGAFPNTETQKLTASDGARFDEFGNSVAVDGDSIAVGAPQAAVDGNDSQGAVYVFERLGSGAFPNTESQKLTADDGAAFDFFGNSAAIDGDTLVIGAPFADIGVNGNQGAAYVFERGFP